MTAFTAPPQGLADLPPREPLTMFEWAELYRKLSPEENPDYAGDFSLDNTPALRGVLAALSQRWPQEDVSGDEEGTE